MSNRLESFVKDNRDDFDKFEPGPVVWNNIQQQLKKPAEKKSILIPLQTLKWSAAAAAILMLGLGAYFVFAPGKKPQEVANTQPATGNNLPVPADKDSFKTTPIIKESPKEQGGLAQVAQLPNARTKEDVDAEEMGHYIRLIEIKQQQVSSIKKDEPLLYQKFSGDFNRLDSIYHSLKKELPVNPNHEQILEAMIQNLQYQEAILNQQLNIIKKIKNAKKTAYEKAYKTV